MRWRRLAGNHLGFSVIAAFLVWVVFLPGDGTGFEALDLVSGVMESPAFKGKDPIDKLHLAAELLRQKKLPQSDMSFLLLDWADQYLREPTDSLERLKRWADLCNDDKLSHLRIPREFLNRMLLAEHLVSETPYLKSSPQARLEILKKLSEKNLVDWSVSLAYARVYAGGIIMGAKNFGNSPPREALTVLKSLKDRELVGWHYRVPTEAILVAEDLALDPGYRKNAPYDQLLKLKELEGEGLITNLTRKELEKLPAWRLLTRDSTFLKADHAKKKERLMKLKSEGIISGSTYSDLIGIFRPAPLASPRETPPAPIPQKALPLPK